MTPGRLLRIEKICICSISASFHLYPAYQELMLNVAAFDRRSLHKLRCRLGILSRYSIAVLIIEYQ